MGKAIWIVSIILVILVTVFAHAQDEIYPSEITDSSGPQEPLEVTEGSSSYEKDYTNPNFTPKEDWSIKYVDLFKHAIKKKYNVSDNELEDNLVIQSVVKGTKVDGVATPSSREKYGRIHYIYKIDWAYFNGYGDNNGLSFIVQDDSGNDLTDEQIFENIKTNLIPVFAIDIIAEEKAVQSCNPPVKFPSLRAPFYANNNNILFDSSRNELIFSCGQIINTEENNCLREFFSLQTGEKFLSQEIACAVYSDSIESNGRDTEIKIMPETASEKAIERLGELNFTVELKEVGKGNETKMVYEVKAKKQGRFLGLFKVRGEIIANVDAKTGEILSTKKPWWSFLTSGI